MVADNIKTDLDITNGKIIGIVLHPEHRKKSRLSEALIPTELYPCQPRNRATWLEGLEEEVVPIESISTSYNIKVYIGHYNEPLNACSCP